MKLSRLFTYSFDPNVGPYDRVFRIFSGIALAIAPWIGWITAPLLIGVLLSAFGVAWFITGAVSRCGMYYVLGLSTRS